MTSQLVEPTLAEPMQQQDFKVSVSSYATWQRCEQRYYYRHVRNLKPRLRDLAMQTGTLIHEYMELYYRGLMEGIPADDSHELAQERVREHWNPRLIAWANAAFQAGLEQQTADYLDMLNKVGRICGRYYRARGKSDAERYDVLLVEQKLDIRVGPGIRSTGKADLVMRDRSDGFRWLWEHKSVKNVPQQGIRIRDFQTFLYGVKLRYTEPPYPTDGVLWNYIRTREPEVPKQNKDGRFSMAQIDSTWEVYHDTVVAEGGDPSLYGKMYDALKDKELSSFLPRYEHYTLVDERLVLGDYVTEASRMRYARQRWALGLDRPVRTLTRDCGFCEFLRLCEAALLGQDEQQLITNDFTDEWED